MCNNASFRTKMHHYHTPRSASNPQQRLMALADRTRQSGNAATRWPITVLFSNGSMLEPLESKMVIGHRVAASPLCRVLSARAISPRSGSSARPEHLRASAILPPPITGSSPRRSLREGSPLIRLITCRLSAVSGRRSVLWRPRTGVSRLTTCRLDTTNHSDRCLEAFHCSSAVNGSCPIRDLSIPLTHIEMLWLSV